MEIYSRCNFASSLIVIACYLLSIHDQLAAATPLHLNSTFENILSGNFLFRNNSQNKLARYRIVGELNEACFGKSGCRENAYRCSSENICVCAPGYMPDEFQQACIGGIGSKCLYDNHCILNAYCKGQEICTCKFEFPIPSSDNWTCKGSGSQLSIVLPSTFIFAGLVSVFWMIPYRS